MSEFLYGVRDNSMSGDRIRKDDVVLIKQTQDHETQNIYAIAHESDISKLDLRRIRRQKDGYELIASNPKIPNEFRKTILVVGKIIMIYKNT